MKMGPYSKKIIEKNVLLACAPILFEFYDIPSFKKCVGCKEDNFVLVDNCKHVSVQQRCIECTEPGTESGRRLESSPHSEYAESLLLTIPTIS